MTTFDGGFEFTRAELNDPRLFAAKVEASRRQMVKALGASTVPLTVWTSGRCVLQVQAGTGVACVTCGQLPPGTTVDVSV